jgi:hypothetical protein
MRSKWGLRAVTRRLGACRASRGRPARREIRPAPRNGGAYGGGQDGRGRRTRARADARNGPRGVSRAHKSGKARLACPFARRARPARPVHGSSEHEGRHTHGRSTAGPDEGSARGQGAAGRRRGTARALSESSWRSGARAGGRGGTGTARALRSARLAGRAAGARHCALCPTATHTGTAARAGRRGGRRRPLQPWPSAVEVGPPAPLGSGARARATPSRARVVVGRQTRDVPSTDGGAYV